MKKGPNKKLKVALIFGGKSSEHEVSLMSAKNVAQAMDKNKYDIIFVGIDKKGRWLQAGTAKDLENKKVNVLSIKSNLTNVSLVPINGIKTGNQGDAVSTNSIDVAFPILHGAFGEDGTMQGLLKLSGIPFVGPSVLGSAVSFDKDVTKRLLTNAGIPNTKFVVYKKGDTISYTLVKKILGLPLIIKPANSGSSVGIKKAKNEKEFNIAIKYAYKFDRKILIEEFIEEKREIECAVLGNDKPIASICGEVITSKKHDFYSYEAKYLDENGAALEIPAKLSKSMQIKLQNLAIKTFKVLECEGLSRVDFFIKKNGEILVNEINTIPGFTNISMYPRLWEESGISYSKLIDKLINLAIDRHKKEQKIQTSYKK